MIPLGDSLLVPPSASTQPAGAAAGDAERRTAWQREMEKAQMAAWFAHGPIGGAPAPAALSAKASEAAVPATLPPLFPPASPPHDSEPTGMSTDVGSGHGAGSQGTEAAQAQDTSPPPSGGGTASTGSGTPQGSRASSQVAGERGGEGSATASTKTSSAYAMARPAPGAPDVPAARVERAAATPERSEGGVPRELVPPALQDVARAAGQELALPPLVPPSPASDLFLLLPPLLPGVPTELHEGAPPPAVAQAARGTRPAAAPAITREPVRIHTEWAADGVRVWMGLDASVLPYQEGLGQQIRRWAAAQGVKVVSLACNGRVVDEEDAGGAPGAGQTDRNVEVNSKENA